MYPPPKLEDLFAKLPPKLEDMFAKLAGGKSFTKLDPSHV